MVARLLLGEAATFVAFAASNLVSYALGRRTGRVDALERLLRNDRNRRGTERVKP